MTLRILDAMARRRCEFEGDLVGNIIRHMPFTEFTAESLNPFRSAACEDPEMVALQRWKQKRRWDRMFGSRKRIGGE